MAIRLELARKLRGPLVTVFPLKLFPILLLGTFAHPIPRGRYAPRRWAELYLVPNLPAEFGFGNVPEVEDLPSTTSASAVASTLFSSVESQAAGSLAASHFFLPSHPKMR